MTAGAVDIGGGKRTEQQFTVNFVTGRQDRRQPAKRVDLYGNRSQLCRAGFRRVRMEFCQIYVWEVNTKSLKMH